MFSNPFLIRLRNFLRTLGILRLIQISPLYRFLGQGYEARFDRAMMASLNPGMSVYDIGANIGYYTQKFADLVGSTGQVHAFEPVPASAQKVRELQQFQPWIHVHQCALADQAGEPLMHAEPEDTSPTNRIAISSLDDSSALSVPVITLDQATEKFGVPDVIKVDVEGYELFVLRGALRTLASKRLQYVFVEIHFGLLEARNLSTAGEEIYKMLVDSGFEVTYTDFSHLLARRL